MAIAKKNKKLPLKKPGRSQRSTGRKLIKGNKVPLPPIDLTRVKAPAPTQAVFGLLLSVVLTIAGLFSLPNFHILLTENSFPARLFVHPSLLWLGLIGLYLSFRFLPEAPERAEFGRGKAYLWFSIFFGLCFFSRFYKPEEACADYWFDFMVEVRDIRAILDVHDRFIFFPAAAREPFFYYLNAGLWTLFPDATGLWITRLSSTLVDVFAIWGLYLLGSTLRGRRMGLILMGFWALSMPMIFWCYLMGGTNASVLASIWALVFFFRLLKKASLRRFVYLALTLAFGACTYVPFRPWIPVMIM